MSEDYKLPRPKSGKTRDDVKVTKKGGHHIESFEPRSEKRFALPRLSDFKRVKHNKE